LTEPLAKLCGLRAWQADNRDACAEYVKNEIEHHVSSGVELSAAELPACVGCWLSHYPGSDAAATGGDEIVSAARRVLGKDRLRPMVEAAQASEDDWLISSIGLAWFHEVMRTEGMATFHGEGRYNDFMKRAVWPMFARVIFDGKCPSQLTESAYEHYVLFTCLGQSDFVALFGVDGCLRTFSYISREDVAKFDERVLYLLENSEVGRAHPDDPAARRQKAEEARMRPAGDWAALDPILVRRWKTDVEGKMKNGDKAGLLAECVSRIDGMSLLRMKEFPWELFDKRFNGADVVQAVNDYDFSADESDTGGFTQPVALLPALRGDVASANLVVDRRLDVNKALAKAIEDRRVYSRAGVVDNLATRLMYASWPWVLRMLGRSDEAAAMMSSFGLTWASADAKADAFAAFDDPWCRKRGSTEQHALAVFTAEDYSWMIRLQYVLCTTWREVPSAEVIAALPSPDLLESYITNVSPNPGGSVRLRKDVGNPLLLAAEVCEKLERPADALLYLERALRVDPTDPTTDMRPTTQAIGLALRGRVLATQGKAVDAEASFEEAVEVSHRTGLRLLEMFALRDLKRSILDTDGRGEEGTKRLKVVLQEMKGPPAELTKLLGGELNAEEIMRS
jgi:tetratricopeptide (TPR) repeat protein